MLRSPSQDVLNIDQTLFNQTIGPYERAGYKYSSQNDQLSINRISYNTQPDW